LNHHILASQTILRWAFCTIYIEYGQIKGPVVYYLEEGIIGQYTMLGTSYQNGVAER